MNISKRVDPSIFSLNEPVEHVVDRNRERLACVHPEQ
jgi:hypothetical protein